MSLDNQADLDLLTPAAPAPPPFARQKRNVIIAAFVWCIGTSAWWALTTPGSPEERLAELASALGFAGLLLLWTHYDARERQIRLSRLMQLGIFFVAAIGFPVYAFRSRGAIGGLRLLGAVIALAIVLLLLDAGVHHTLYEILPDHVG